MGMNQPKQDAEHSLPSSGEFTNRSQRDVRCFVEH